MVAIGESGLDYFYDKAPRDRQAASFRTHVRAARETGLPLIVHTRDADEDTMAILEEEMAAGPYTGVIHCFSSGRGLAERAVAIGLYLGIGGMLTFRRSEEIRAIVKDMPIERLILETDSPYLAPVPMRGKTNEPAFTAHVAKVLAELKGVGLAELEAVTTEKLLRAVPEGPGLPPCRMKVTVLGCGTSAGVPQIGCGCPVCTSTDPRNKRRRCSILIEAQGLSILVDTGPDLREQCLSAGIGRIDALLYTHAHADHIHGIDDLRAINNLMMAPVEAYAHASVFERIRSRFPYVFEGGRSDFGYWRPEIRPHPIDGPFRLGEVEVDAFRQKHGRGESWGFRIGRFAYSTDTRRAATTTPSGRSRASTSGSSTRCATGRTRATRISS